MNPVAAQASRILTEGRVVSSCRRRALHASYPSSSTADFSPGFRFLQANPMMCNANVMKQTLTILHEPPMSHMVQSRRFEHSGVCPIHLQQRTNAGHRGGQKGAKKRRHSISSTDLVGRMIWNNAPFFPSDDAVN